MTTTEAQDVFRAVQQSYEKGKRIDTQGATSMSEEIRQYYLRRLPDDDIELLKRTRRINSRALHAAKNGDLDKAREFMAASYQSLDFDALAPDSRHLILNFCRAVEAFIHFQGGAIGRGRLLMRKALQHVNTLKDECNYRWVDGRRTHLACNLVRLDAFGGKPERGARRCFGLLLYVEGNDDAWPFEELAMEAEQDFAAPQQRDFGFHQISKELTQLYANVGDDERRAIISAGQAACNGVDGTERMQITNHWIDSKLYRLQNRTYEFLDRASDIFEHGRVVSPLWCSTVREVYEVCNETDSSSSAQFAQQLLEDAGSEENIYDLNC